MSIESEFKKNRHIQTKTMNLPEPTYIYLYILTANFVFMKLFYRDIMANIKIRPCMSHKRPKISRLKFLKTATYNNNLHLLNNVRSFLFCYLGDTSGVNLFQTIFQSINDISILIDRNIVWNKFTPEVSPK